MNIWNQHEFDTLTDAKRYAKRFDCMATICEKNVTADMFWVLDDCNHSAIVSGRNFGVPPVATSFEKNIYIGCGFGIYIYSQNLKLKRSIALATPLYEFLHDVEHSLLIAICEIDLYCFDTFGNERWCKALDDIVTTWKLDKGKLDIITFEKKRYEFNIEDGRMM